MQVYDSKGRFLNRGSLDHALRERLGPSSRSARNDGREEPTVWIIDDDGRCWRLRAARGECVEVCADDLPEPVRRFLA